MGLYGVLGRSEFKRVNKSLVGDLLSHAVVTKSSAVIFFAEKM